MVEYLNWKDESGLVDFALVSERFLLLFNIFISTIEQLDNVT